MSLSGRKIFWLLLIVITLSACKQEPMIKLSKENQMKIEKKQAENKETQLEQKNNQKANTSDQVVLDSNSWIKEAEDVNYRIEKFLPINANQVKIFSNGKTSYVDYMDQTSQQMQVRETLGAEKTIELYRWNTEVIELYGKIEKNNRFTNYLKNSMEANELEKSLIILQSPLKVGTEWLYDGNIPSHIVGLYKEVNIGDQIYQEVIEVVTKFEEGDRHQLIAANKGIIAQWQENKEDYFLAESITDNVMLVSKKEWYMPQSSTEEPLIQKEIVDFAWQTNDTLASAFQRFYYDNQWITPEIQVVDIYESNGIAHLNFSSGVVASLNQHPAGEKAVAIAMMVNIADYYSVNQVRLEVFGNGMLLNTIPYPPNGIHQIDSNWIEQEDNSIDETPMSSEELTLE
ncbi:hypothetical protein [Facklamia sp. 7083-14-GEN3]|uniref:hypothetical protein n=1 Tax=Facklamia sp. 7083-14-GEN3 TaxID=2973478 RepID=UPI00215CFC55|nr:hypothetical protein [Facklamia sp. 7083-14-GEN3]MCR8969841.1 hypothetical protein [Facklamia sp. 7083-14-GEN3]